MSYNVFADGPLPVVSIRSQRTTATATVIAPQASPSRRGQARGHPRLTPQMSQGSEAEVSIPSPLHLSFIRTHTLIG